MKIYRTIDGIVLEKEGQFFLSEKTIWDEFINRTRLFDFVKNEIASCESYEASRLSVPGVILAPVVSQEVWAAGVTYLRSKTARMEESQESGGATFYDKVYDAERPELFFKSTPSRVVGYGAHVRIRKDSTWNVPEPELNLFISSTGTIEGYSIGNDMSSRSIEGENPLYLPQAKTYDGSAAIGPCILVTEKPLSPDTMIAMSIFRKTDEVFTGSINIGQMKRSHQELVDFLFRECSFATGCFLMTGTCVVPGNDFTLNHGDLVKIMIEEIGTLVNTVE